MAFEAGTLLGRLRLDTSGFRSSIIEAEGLSKLFGQNLTTFIANPLLGIANLAKSAFQELTSSIRDALAFGDKIGDLATQTGVSADWLSGMRFAAEQSNASLEELVQSLGFMQRAMASVQAEPLVAAGNAANQAADRIAQARQALIENADVMAAIPDLAEKLSQSFDHVGESAQQSGRRDPFATLGVSVRDINGRLRATEAVFEDVAEAIRRIPNAAERTAVSMEIFGRSGARLLPLFAEGRDGMARFADEARRLGIVVGDNVAAEMGNLNDVLGVIPQAFLGLKLDLVRGLMDGLGISTADLREGLISIAEELRPIARGLGEFLGQLIGSENAGKVFVGAIETITSALKLLVENLQLVIDLVGVFVGQSLGGTIGALLGSAFGPAGTIIGGLIGRGIGGAAGGAITHAVTAPDRTPTEISMVQNIQIDGERTIRRVSRAELARRDLDLYLKLA